MGTMLIYIVIALILFAMVFMLKKRFGLLGLALAVGYLLSELFGKDIGLIVSGFGMSSGPLNLAITTSLVILLPSVFLLPSSRACDTLVGRVVGAAIFSLLALAFLVEPLSHFMVPQGFGVDYYTWLINNRTIVIGAGLLIAILDLIFTKQVSFSDGRRKH